MLAPVQAGMLREAACAFAWKEGKYGPGCQPSASRIQQLMKDIRQYSAVQEVVDLGCGINA